jgi:propionate CoA-transferase
MQLGTAEQAAKLVQDGDTVVVTGSGSGMAIPEALLAALEDRFKREGAPRNITAVHPVGMGNRGNELGASHFAHEGLLKRVVCGTVVDAPLIARLAMDNRIEAYTLPQGVLSQLFREIAGGRPGLTTHVGLNTFVDPRHQGGKQSQLATEDLVEVVERDGQEYLFYKSFKVDVALLRGTTADEDGNISHEQEAVLGEMLSMAQAARRSGGLVIVQVKRLARSGSLPAKTVKIPGFLVDFVVVEPRQMQTYQSFYDPSFAGELKIPLTDFPVLPLDERAVIARRAALELRRGAVCNIGAGICTGIGLVAAREDVLDLVTLTNEQGLIGGAPANGLEAGAARNYSAIVDQPYQFDFYDGGGIDIAFLSCVEIDRTGNVNITRFANKLVGVGGFINISQNAKKMVFGGSFTAGGLKVSIANRELNIVEEGRHSKFVKDIEMISFSSKNARNRGQVVLYVTERAVFSLANDGLELIEIAPGIDLQTDVLEHIPFEIKVSPSLKTMPNEVFSDGPLGLKARIESEPLPVHPRIKSIFNRTTS